LRLDVSDKHLCLNILVFQQPRTIPSTLLYYPCDKARISKCLCSIIPRTQLVTGSHTRILISCNLYEECEYEQKYKCLPKIRGWGYETGNFLKQTLLFQVRSTIMSNIKISKTSGDKI